MPVIMLMTKTERLNSWATMVAIPSPTVIDSSAMRNGMSPATTAPNTSMSTTMEMGSPKSTSPLRRSLEDSVLKSLPMVWSPVTATAKPPVPLAACTAATTGLMSESVAARSSIRAACPPADTSELPGPRSARTSLMPRSARSPAARPATTARKASLLAVAVLELTTMTSVGCRPASPPVTWP